MQIKKETPDGAIDISDSGQVLLLLDKAAPGSDHKISITPDKTRDSTKPRLPLPKNSKPQSPDTSSSPVVPPGSR